MIQINASLLIPVREIRYTYSTSTGPGGQHVNKVATRVTLLFDVANSPSLSSSQRLRIQTALATRINKQGVMRVLSSKHRSQKANRESAIDRFVVLLRDVLRPRKRRKQTTVSTAQKRRRLDQKKKRGETKRLRSKVQPIME